jgi:hypothetical protein
MPFFHTPLIYLFLKKITIKFMGLTQEMDKRRVEELNQTFLDI